MTRVAALVKLVRLSLVICGLIAPGARAYSTVTDVKIQVASVNLCTDQLVMLLADPEQTLALSTLSRDVGGSYYHGLAGSFEQADPIAEQLLPLGPDAVVTPVIASFESMAGKLSAHYVAKLAIISSMRLNSWNSTHVFIDNTLDSRHSISHNL